VGTGAVAAGVVGAGAVAEAVDELGLGVGALPRQDASASNTTATTAGRMRSMAGHLRAQASSGRPRTVRCNGPKGAGRCACICQRSVG
jgi:hypothetical protein